MGHKQIKIGSSVSWEWGKGTASGKVTEIYREEITKTIRDVSMGGYRITVLIAHRLSTIMHADTIYVLEKG
ncbi:MAG: hypothetical protein RLZZ69_3529, partial [Cyanobacteriota bacterium]